MNRLLPLALLVVVIPTLSSAQEADRTTAPSPSPAPPPAPDRTPATEVAPTPETGLLQEKLNALTEDANETNALLEGLKRLKLSGYVQPRFVYADNSRQGVTADGDPRVRDGFTVRRARLKVKYDVEWSALVLQIDASPRGLTLKDAEVHLVLPWTNKNASLVVGQMKWPFGYEVPQSSSAREFPERTRATRAFLSGERDRGAKIAAKVGWFRFQGGVFDGNGVDNEGFEGVDNDRNKDVVGRAGVDFKWISGGVSGWYGRTFRPARADGSEGPARTFDRTRIAGDLQLSGKLLGIGKTALRGEFIAGRTYWKNGVEQFGVPALGWYALLVQNLGEKNAIALRYDRFDPRAGIEDRASSSEPTAPAGTNAVGTAGIALMHQWNESLEVTVAYEVPMTAGPAGVLDPLDNVFTLQFQAKY